MCESVCALISKHENTHTLLLLFEPEAFFVNVHQTSAFETHPTLNSAIIMVDYSRFNKIVLEDELADADTQNLQKLAEIAKKDPAKLNEIKAGLEKMKQSAIKAKARSVAGTKSHVGRQASSVQSVLSAEAKKMQENLAELRQKEKDMEEQQKRLEQLASAGDGASILKFFESQGLSPEEMQKMMGGSQQDTKEVIQTVAAKPVFDVEKEKEINSTLHMAENLNAALGGKEVEVAEPPKPNKIVAKKPEKNFIIPEHTQQIPTQGKNKGHIVVQVALPLLTSANDVELDVSPGQFRLRSRTPHDNEEYLLNFALLRGVDTSQTVAKWIKKEKSLKVVLCIA